MVITTGKCFMASGAFFLSFTSHTFHPSRSQPHKTRRNRLRPRLTNLIFLISDGSPYRSSCGSRSSVISARVGVSGLIDGMCDNRRGSCTHRKNSCQLGFVVCASVRATRTYPSAGASVSDGKDFPRFGACARVVPRDNVLERGRACERDLLDCPGRDERQAKVVVLVRCCESPLSDTLLLRVLLQR